MPRIQVLPPETSRLIAAGEVIDRPAALLRELLDNALDAGAGEIQVEISGGGSASTLVVDDGCGMDADDLALSILPHATSKIRTADDLLSARSLGFRGEALASIAAAARLEITSRSAAAREARRLVSLPGSPTTIEATHGRVGTRVLVEGLFDNFPARRQFLKRPQAEAALCRQVFAEKALAHPAVAFRFSSEGRDLDRLLARGSLLERVLELHSELHADLLHELRFSGEGFVGRVVAAGPSLSRGDRRLMQVFVNRRRIQDFGLISGLDYGYEGLLPGGLHPVAFLFVEIDPALADFNIHPAKREVRFKDPGQLRQAVTRALRSFLADLVRARPETALPRLEEGGGGLFGPAAGGEGEGKDSRAGIWAVERTGGGGFGRAPIGEAGGRDWADLLRSGLGGPGPVAAAPGGEGPGPRYLGTVLGLFLVAESGDAVYLIDQHAAHERLLFDELSARAAPIQELLVPARFESEDEAEEGRLEVLLPALAEAGFSLEREGEAWLVTALPSPLADDPLAALRELLAGEGGDPHRALRAMTACKAAVKDGEALDTEAARDLALRALALPEPRCPHGRPVWARLSREELFRLVRRIV